MLPRMMCLSNTLFSQIILCSNQEYPRLLKALWMNNHNNKSDAGETVYCENNLNYSPRTHVNDLHIMQDVEKHAVET